MRKGKDEPYTVIFRTDDADKYKHIEDECRRMIGHEKPTVDAVPVVRCGECKRRYKPMDDDLRNEIWCEFIGSTMRKDDFCSYGCADGERKDGERRTDEQQP